MLGRIDYHRSPNSIFGRYLATSSTQSIPLGASDTALSLLSGFDDLAQSLAVGDNRVFGTNTVNSLRLRSTGLPSAASRRIPSTRTIWAPTRSYYPHVMTVSVQGGFRITNLGPSRFVANAAQLTNDLTLVRGTHQISVGGSVAYWRYRLEAHARSGGLWDFTGAFTGLALADLLMGRVAAGAQWTRVAPDGSVARALCPGHLASEAVVSRSMRASGGSRTSDRTS